MMCATTMCPVGINFKGCITPKEVSNHDEKQSIDDHFDCATVKCMFEQ